METISAAARRLPSLLRSRSGRSHVTLPVPTRLLQTDIHSFLGVLRFCLLGPMSLSFSCHYIRCTNHRREHSQQNESNTLIGLFPRKECISVWSSRVGTGSVTWLRPERLRRRLVAYHESTPNFERDKRRRPLLVCCFARFAASDVKGWQVAKGNGASCPWQQHHFNGKTCWPNFVAPYSTDNRSII